MPLPVHRLDQSKGCVMSAPQPRPRPAIIPVEPVRQTPWSILAANIPGVIASLLFSAVIIAIAVALLAMGAK